MLASVASTAASAGSQMVSYLLSQLLGTSSSSSSSSSSSDASSTSATSSTSACSGTGMTGSTQGSLSGDILMALMQQQQSGGSSSSSSSTTSQSMNPLQQLFSSMDTNGDGEVSESEMESYIEGIGGTQAQADALYTSLSQETSSSTGTTDASAATSSAGISESQMQNAVSQSQQAHQAHGGHHHHHGGGAGGSADQVANTLLQALDTNDDGSVTQDELTSFVTANGGTSTDAANDWAALDTSGSPSLTSADFAKAWENLQSQQSSQSSGAMITSLLNAFTQSASASANTATLSLSA